MYKRQGQVLRPKLFNQILSKAKGKEFEETINQLILRSQSQAEYSILNIGHFGLGLARYAHFTSPIRRYSDLLVHRALRSDIRSTNNTTRVKRDAKPNVNAYEKIYPYSGSHLVWLGLVPDYYMSQARQLLVQQHTKEHLKIGISGYKVDEVDGYDFWLWPDHATFPSGTSGETMRQTYGLLMQELLYKDLFKQNNQRTYGNVRSSNGAASGYPFVIYSDSYNHKEYITGISSASLCGILWTPEIRNASSAREWLNRMQTVCFSSMAKLNAWAVSYTLLTLPPNREV